MSLGPVACHWLIPLFHAQAGRRSAGFEVGRIDHDVFGSQPGHHLREDTLVTPSLPTVVKDLVRALFPWRIPLSQAIAIDEDNPAQDTPIIDARLAMGLRKIGLKPRHLRVAQPEEIRHVTARFSDGESRRSTQINGS